MLTTTHPQGTAQGHSQMVIPKPEKIDIDFTDAKLTDMAGSLFVARLANQLKLPDLLKEQIRLKKRHGSNQVNTFAFVAGVNRITQTLETPRLQHFISCS